MKSKLLMAGVLSTSFLIVSCGGGGGNSLNDSQLPDAQILYSSLSGKVNDEEGNIQPQGIKTLQTVQDVSDFSISLIVDKDNDGVFDEKTDDVYKTFSQNGIFSFKNIKLPYKTARAKIIIEKDGYLPYTKILTLDANNSKNILAEIKPVLTETEKLNDLSIKPQSSSISPSSLTIGNITISIDIDKLSNVEPDTVVKVSVEEVNLNENEGKYIPVTFKGKDLEGNDISFKAHKVFFLDIKTVDGKELIPKDQKSKVFNIEISGLDQNLSGEYPVFGFGTENGEWEEIGKVTVENGSTVIKLNKLIYNWFVLGEQVEENKYKNIKLSIYARETLSDEPVSDVHIYGFNASTGNYVEITTNQEGVATAELIVDQNADCNNLGYDLYYLDPFKEKEIKILTLDQFNDGCRYEIKLVNPYNTEVTIETGEPNRFVCVESKDGFIDCKESDEKGKAIFKLIEGKEYTAFSIGIGTADFVALEGRKVSLYENNKKKNTPPVVDIYVHPTSPKVGEGVIVAVSAKDADMDKVHVSEFSCGEEKVKPTSIYTHEDYGIAFIEYECVYPTSGNKRISAVVTDGKEEIRKEININVQDKNSNNPPKFLGYDIFTEEDMSVTKREIIVNKGYKIYPYYYDPEGDEVSLSVTDSQCHISKDATGKDYIYCKFTTPGEKNIQLKLNDGKENGEKTANIKLIVISEEEAKKPEVEDVFVDTDGNNNIELYVYLEGNTSDIKSVKFQNFERNCTQLRQTDLYECKLSIPVDQFLNLVQSNKNKLVIEYGDNESLNVDIPEYAVEFAKKLKEKQSPETGIGHGDGEGEISLDKVKVFIGNTKCFYFDREGLSCRISNFNIDTGSFEFSCKNGDSDNLQVVEKEGKVYIKEGDGTLDEVVFLDEYKLCLVTEAENEYVCIIRKDTCENDFSNDDETDYGFFEGVKKYTWKEASAKVVYDFMLKAGKIWGYDRILFECDIEKVDDTKLKTTCTSLDPGKEANSKTLEFPEDARVDVFIGDDFICFEDSRPSNTLFDETQRCVFDANKVSPNPLFRQGEKSLKEALIGKPIGGGDGAIIFKENGELIYCDRHGIDQKDITIPYEIKCTDNECYIHISDNDGDIYFKPLYTDGKAFVYHEYKYPENDTTKEYEWNNNALRILDECPPIMDVIKDYSQYVYGTFSGEIDDYTKIRIVPDINWKEGNYEGIICKVKEDGSFGTECYLTADNVEELTAGNQCQVIVFEDRNSNWRYDKEEKSIFSTTVSCPAINNLTNLNNYENYNNGENSSGDNNEFTSTQIKINPMEVSFDKVVSLLDDLTKRDELYVLSYDEDFLIKDIKLEKTGENEYKLTASAPEGTKVFDLKVVEENGDVYILDLTSNTKEKIFLANYNDNDESYMTNVLCTKNINSQDVDCLFDRPILFDTSSDRASNTLRTLGETVMLKWKENIGWVESSYLVDFYRGEFKDPNTGAVARFVIEEDEKGLVKLTGDVDTQIFYVIAVDDYYTWAITYIFWYDENGNIEDKDVRIFYSKKKYY